ncbi:DMT family transporter [Paenisporosarcina cavernae]|uniref:DMT family transporter n=1 Tax=Paenisporosarcina cavernae TaxID=2320858 RepID=A0A385YVG3_9BACL|nr:DMT family transporter [Paenisporosarcina cavernae]AYC30849.1 DMT family transporter [Paenisporosarcina cavernae]
MISGIFFALIAGSLVGLQNIFNNQVNQRVSSWTTTTLVLGLGFLASFIIGLFVEGAGMFHFQNMHVAYWFSGVIGVGVVTSMVLGLRHLGATFAISIALVSQLIFGLLWDTFGWLGLEKVPLTWQQIVGVSVMILGVLIFKLGGIKWRRKVIV